MTPPPSGPSSEARRHHVMPRCYLEGFTLPTSSDQLYAIDAKRGADYMTNLVNLVVEADFYRVPDGPDPNYAETLLAKAETNATPVIRRINETLTLPAGDDLFHLQFLVANLWTRARHYRSTINKFVRDVAKKMTWMTLATPERWAATVAKMEAEGSPLPAADYKGMKAFVESDLYDIETDRRWLVNSMLESTARIFDILVQRKWYLSVTESPFLVSSDQPVDLKWIKPVGGSWPPGFGLVNTAVTLPLTRRVYLEGYFPPDLPRPHGDVARLKIAEVALLNTRTIEMAGDVMLAPDRNFVWMDEIGATKGASDLLTYIHRQRQSERT